MKYVDPMFVLGALVVLVFGIMAGRMIESIVFALIFVLVGALFARIDQEDEAAYEQSNKTEMKN